MDTGAGSGDGDADDGTRTRVWYGAPGWPEEGMSSMIG